MLRFFPSSSVFRFLGNFASRPLFSLCRRLPTSLPPPTFDIYLPSIPAGNRNFSFQVSFPVARGSFANNETFQRLTVFFKWHGTAVTRKWLKCCEDHLSSILSVWMDTYHGNVINNHCIYVKIKRKSPIYHDNFSFGEQKLLKAHKHSL